MVNYLVMFNRDFKDIMKKQTPKSTKNTITEMIKSEVEKILKEMNHGSNIKEQKRIEGDKRQSDEVDFFDTTDIHGDEGEFEGWQDPDQQDHFYPEDEFEFDFAPADEIGLYDEDPGVTSDPEDFMDPWPEDESVKIREQRDIYDPYSPGPREYSDEPESSEYDEQEAWEWDAKMVDDEWADYSEDY